MKIEIQHARPADAAAIAAVHADGIRAAYGGVLPEAIPGPKGAAARTQQWSAWLGRSRARTFVARTGGLLVGFCALHRAPGESSHRTGEIPSLYVLPAYWRRGLGRRLCQRALTEAGALGFVQVVLWVLASNERARRFYEELGFRPDGETRVLVERSYAAVHELRYQRELPSTAP